MLLEPLEDRRLLAVDIAFDYSLDTAGFFAVQERRDALERAAAVLEARLEDELTAITPGGSNTWTAVISHPETGNQHDVVDLTIPADTLLIFVGSRNISNLGIGGPGGYGVSGTSQFVNNMVTRGQSGIATGSGDSATNTDFAPWGGNIVFDSDAVWNYSAAPPSSGINDFYSVAVHEIAHLLGVGTSHSWTNQVNASSQFTGTHSVQAHGSPIALDPTESHWASGTDSTLPGTITVQETALDPQITVGTRKELTTLDWAGIQDIGWEVAPVSFAPTLDTISDIVINDNASERVINLAGITAGGSESQVIQITASSSDPSVVPNPTVTYTSPETTGTLKFTPVADQSGTSTITVTLEDGGADNILATTDDNDTFTRSFLVTVSLSFDITFDYSLDTAGFFADQARKDALERAANVFENRLEDNLAAIQPSGSNTWTAVINHPETGNTENPVDLVIPIDTLTVFVGSRVMSNLGIGGSGGYQVSGTSAFVNNMSTRGQSGIATGSGDSSTNTDFAPWGGSLTFSRDASWNFSTAAPTSGTNDFYSTAIHELAHLLGFGRADSWDNLVNSSDEFAGTAAVAAHGSTIPLTATKSHWASSTSSTLPGTATMQETAMDPGLTVGTRKEFTTLDWAALDDIGWELSIPNQAPTLDAISNLSIAEDAAQQTVNLAGIGPGPAESEAVRITASSNNTSLVPDPTVNYTNGNATGTLTFTPVAEQNGTATITVIVEDAGDDGDLNETADNLTLTRTFDVVVSAVNDTPTLDVINNISIAEDAAEQTVNLAGIGPGPAESEAVRITASSNNTSLVPDPAVIYTNGNAIGTLTFTPVAEQNGTATITVIVEDAGDDGDLDETADNLTLTRTFDVVVSSTNDSPSFDVIADLTIAEDAAEQTINLSSINAGLNETQSLRITTESTNTSLVPTPTVIYTSAETTGVLKLTPVADQHGVSSITVNLEDAGIDNNFATALDNVMFSRTFVVTVTAVNDEPVAGNVTYQPVENQLFSKDKARGLSTQAHDVEGSDLAFSVVTAPSNGSLALNADGSFTYTPDTNFNKTDSFTYRAHDGAANSNTATVTLEIDTVFPWYNSDQERDVNNDGVVTPLDALWIINTLNNLGSHQLTTNRAEGIAPPYLDVNRDGFATPADVLWIINHLNQQSGTGEGEAEPLESNPGPVDPATNQSQVPESSPSTYAPLPISPATQWEDIDNAFRSFSEDHSSPGEFDHEPTNSEELEWWSAPLEETLEEWRPGS